MTCLVWLKIIWTWPSTLKLRKIPFNSFDLLTPLAAKISAEGLEAIKKLQDVVMILMFAISLTGCSFSISVVSPPLWKYQKWLWKALMHCWVASTQSFKKDIDCNSTVICIQKLYMNDSYSCSFSMVFIVCMYHKFTATVVSHKMEIAICWQNKNEFKVTADKCLLSTSNKPR